MATVSEDPEPGCVAACRGAGPESAVRREDDRDGGAQQVGSERPGYACHGSRLDRDPGSVEFQVRRPLEYGAGLRGHRPPGSVSTNPVYEPSYLGVGTDSFAVEIARRCSGHEVIGLVWAFLGACIWFFRRQLRFPQAWLLPPLGGGAPLAERLAFRRFFTRRLISAAFDTVPPGRFTWTSFAVSSLAFGVLYDRWLEGTMAGMLYALAYSRRGSLGDAVAARATTNALLSADTLITGDWSLFS